MQTTLKRRLWQIYQHMQAKIVAQDILVVSRCGLHASWTCFINKNESGAVDLICSLDGMKMLAIYSIYAILGKCLYVAILLKCFSQTDINLLFQYIIDCLLFDKKLLKQMQKRNYYIAKFVMPNQRHQLYVQCIVPKKFF